MPLIEVTKPNVYDHRSRVRLQMNGAPVGGWLIPDLMAPPSTTRALVLVDAFAHQVPETYRGEFQDFAERLRALSNNRFTAAKVAVSEIRAGLWPADRFKIGIHKMGPVPALRLTTCPIEVFQCPGRPLEIIVFPRGQRQAAFTDGSTMPALFECLTSLNVANVFRVYAEDIFEHLKDISDRLNLPQCVQRIKAIRETIGQSVVTKLRTLTPSPEAWQSYRRELLPEGGFEAQTCRWFEDNHATIAEYLYLCCLADWCAGQFFSLVGVSVPPREIEVRGVLYSEHSCRARFTAAYGFDSDIFDSGELALVDEVLSARDSPDALINLTPQGKIASQLRDYLVFLHLVKREGSRIFSRRYAAGDAVIFVSRRNDSTYGHAAADALHKEADRLSAGTSRITTFYGDGGEPLRASLKAQMWLADSVWSLLPEGDEPVGEDLTWIYLARLIHSGRANWLADIA